MANTHKNIIITPNTAVDTSNSYPVIQFSGGDQTTNSDVFLRVYTTSNGTVSFEGNSGQIIAFSADMDKELFVISDSAGIPVFEANASMDIFMNEFGGNTAFHKDSADYEVDVYGFVNARGFYVDGASFGGDPGPAFNKANSAYTFAANNAMLAANSAYGEANVTMNVGNTTAGTFTPRSKRRSVNFLEGSGITITIDDDAALNTANVTITSTGGDTTIAEAAFDQANTVWDSANSNYTFAANDAMLAANSAYGEANVTMNVGNTQAGTFTLQGKRRSINFIDGNLMALTFADDAALNTVNITVATSATDDTVATAAFDQANTVWDSANSNYTFAANTVRLIANTAYDAGNTNYTYAANNVMSAANSAYAAGNTNYTYAANNVMLAANSAYAAGNTNYTYAANNVMRTANIASKSISITTPTTPMNVTLWYSNAAIDVTRLAAVCQGTTPSVTYYIRSNSDRSAAAPTDVVTAGSTATSTTTGNEVTTFNNQTISACNWVWIYLSTSSGTVDEFHLTIDYQE